MAIFTETEMTRRIKMFREGLAEKNVDIAFLHTADNVYYLSGVPLLSEWGRPMWSVISQKGPATIIGAEIEKENMEIYSSIKDVRTYDDSQNVWEASMNMIVDFVKNAGHEGKYIGIEYELLPVRVFERLRESFPEAIFVEIGDIVDKLRNIKSEEEMNLLRLGGEVAKIGANAFLDALHENTTELAVASHAVNEMNKAIAALYPGDCGGATSTYAYCQVGNHTLTPHLHATNRRIRKGDVVGLNVFPVIWGYCMELERTFIFGEPSPDQLKALEAATVAAEAGREAIRPGVCAADIDKLTRRILTEYGYANYIRHGTGHAHGIMIGAAGREELGELRLYNKNPLQPNMVVSVEPAVYIPELGGFRHSDVMAISESGAICLTEFPRDISNCIKA